MHKNPKSPFRIWRQPVFQADFRPDNDRSMQQYLMFCKSDGRSQGGTMPKSRLLEDAKQALSIPYNFTPHKIIFL